MTVTLAPERPVVATPTPEPPHVAKKGSMFSNVLRTTDHKTIGKMYFFASLGFFIIGGIMAMLMRAELAYPGYQFLSPEQYNQLFTNHGAIMLLMFATPLFFAFANMVVPIQIGAPDVAFPRLNAFSFWLFLFGSLVNLSGFLTPGGAADFGWFAYTPLSNAANSPGVGADLWIIGLGISGLGSILGAVNFITSIVCMRAPGMTMFRMSVFTWNTLITSMIILVAFPILTAAFLVLLSDRQLGSVVFEAENGGAILWQHLFWFFGHPEVYIIVLPFFGIISEILPVFSRKPIFGYKGLIFATASIAVLSIAVWAHHMYATGSVMLPFFAFLTFMIAVPTGLKMFTWVMTLWRGAITFETPMLWSIGFLVTFLFGGVTGVVLAAPPLDFHVSDTYFVVAHFHYVLFGAVAFAAFGGTYFWFPKFTGRFLNERLGKWHFWMTFVGFHGTFLVQHYLGNEGLARRYGDYLLTDGFAGLNQFSTVFSFVLGASVLPFMWNLYRSYKYGEVTTADDPWGFGNSLEWATTSPPPRHNFLSLPRIRSERPAFELHYPHMLERMELEAHTGSKKHKVQAQAVAASPGKDGATPAGSAGTATAVADRKAEGVADDKGLDRNDTPRSTSERDPQNPDHA